MRLEELRALARSVRFVGGLSVWKTTLELDDRTGIVWLRLRQRLPDRKTGEVSGPMVNVMLHGGIFGDGVHETREDVLELLRWHLRELALHEVDESIEVAGELPFDPHRADEGPARQRRGPGEGLLAAAGRLTPPSPFPEASESFLGQFRRPFRAPEGPSEAPGEGSDPFS